MALTVDYYFAPNSPWTYARLRALRADRASGRRRHQRAAGRSGRQGSSRSRAGCRWPKRAPQRQSLPAARVEGLASSEPAHRAAAEVLSGQRGRRRQADHRGRHARRQRGRDAHRRPHPARRVGGRAQHRRRATWRRCSKPNGLPAQRLDASMSQAVHQRYEQDSQRAIAAGVFGAPATWSRARIFWGQDRLDFLQRRLAKG